MVISVGEKPNIQALERATGYVKTDNRKVIRGYKSIYKSHGTLNLFAILEIVTDAIHIIGNVRGLGLMIGTASINKDGNPAPDLIEAFMEEVPKRGLVIT